MAATNLAAARAGEKSSIKYLRHIARVLMGIAFSFFGVIGLFHLMRMPDNVPAGIKMVNDALTTAGYMNVVSVTMVVVGPLFLINRFVPLALVLIAPILVGIITFHLTMQPSGIGPGAFLSLLELYLAWCYRQNFYPMLSARTTPGTSCSSEDCPVS